jgi:hypothetical protein
VGGKNKPDNSAVVQQQQQQAAEEAAKEKARQDRLTKGLAGIKSAFEGSPTYTTKAFDWNNFSPRTNEAERQYEAAGGTSAQSGQQLYRADLPEGYTIRKVSGGAAANPTSSIASGLDALSGLPKGNSGASNGAGLDTLSGMPKGNTGASYGVADKSYGAFAGLPLSKGAAGATGSGSSDAWEIVGPDGKVHKQGDAFDIQAPDGGTTGGFDDAFYNKYKQSVLDYYMPQVNDQYTKAKQQAIYGLGRSGNLRSSAANDLYADLTKQNTINEAGVRNQADSAAGDLRSQVASERQKATSQLYATEDPEVATQQALAAVRDVNLKQPDLSPLSALFDVASIGGAGLYKGYQGQQQLNAFNGGVAKNKGVIVQ